jgi:hypothetical protein
MTPTQKAEFLQLQILVFEAAERGQAELLQASDRLAVWIDKQIDDAVLQTITLHGVKINGMSIADLKSKGN